MIYEVRKVTDYCDGWTQVEAPSLYEAAENHCECDDERGDAFSGGLLYDVRDPESDKVSRVRVTASVFYSAHDVEE